MAAAINNDNLATLLAALTMLTLVGLFKRGLTVPVVLSGLIIGLAAGEVKRTALFLIPLILLALCVFAVWRLAARLSPAGRRRFITMVGTVALSSSVLAVALLAYPGGARAVSAGLSRLPFEATSAIAWLITLAADGRLQDPEFLAWQQAQFFALMRGAWAVFGWGSLWMTRGWYWVVGGIAGVSVLGNLAGFIRGRENTGEWTAWQKLALAVFALAIGLAGCVLLVNMVSAYFYNRVFAHARYLMTLLIPFSTFVALGLRALTPVRLRPLLVHTLLAALILFDVISLGLTIIPYYYG